MRRWKRWVPGLQILSEYQAAWFPRDVMAGLVLATMLGPVGIAFALASGGPGIYGLFALAPVRALRPQPYSCVRTGFVSRARDSCCRVASLGWRRHACRGPLKHD